uniref:UBX domain-containing protein n=1 Tax=Globodera pallida TaxID=36090 RepID=A0A183BJZ0_GLOPA
MEAENGLKIHRSLKTLYRPPVELMFRGDWEQALELAKTTKMWLLVNVQNALEFASAKINRDIWGVETVQEIIKTNFILWQVYHDSSDGIRIRSYYGLEESYPIIFIVDPRTGEEVQRLRAPDESFFLDLLTTFVAENPTFEARDRQFHEKNGQSRKQNQLNREHIDGPGSSWTPSELSSDEWIKWTVKEADLVSPCPGTVHLSLRLPNGQTERVRMWKAAPLNALFSLLLSRGHSSYNYQLVLDYPRREFVLSNQNRFCPLEEMGFGPQEVIHINTIEESNKETPTKNDEKKSKDEGPSKAKGGMLSNVIKTVTGFFALQSVGLAHGTQTPSEVTTFKVPAVNNQTSPPEMIIRATDSQLKSAFCIAEVEQTSVERLCALVIR